MSENQASPPSIADGPSPMPGCVILAAILAVFGGLAILYTLVAIYQNRTLAAFTGDTPVTRPLATPTAAEIDSAARKLDQLESAIRANRLEKISFTAADLNNLIASRDLLADFRGQTHIARIATTGIEADMSRPVRKGFRGGRRYLNATFVLQPELRRRTIHFRVTDIRAPGREIPRQFIEGFAGLDVFQLDPEHERMGPVMRKLGRIYTEKDRLVVETRIDAPD